MPFWSMTSAKKIGKEYIELAKRQITAANLLILNKIDLLGEKDLKRVKDYLRKISPNAVILESIRCQVPLDLILGFKDVPELRTMGNRKEMIVHVHEAGSRENNVRIFSGRPRP